MPMKPPVFYPAHMRSPAARSAAYNADRGSSTAQGYGRDWQKVRAVVLATHPLCCLCEAAGRLTAATVVDHIKSIKDRPDLRLDMDNLRALCTPCHNARTARDQRGSR